MTTAGRPPSVTFVLGDGRELAVAAALSRSLMQAALAHGVAGIAAECGGACACATCHVQIDERFAARLPPPGPMEQEMLEFVAGERHPTSRLACQIEVTPQIDGLVVRVPAAQ